MTPEQIADLAKTVAEQVRSGVKADIKADIDNIGARVGAIEQRIVAQPVAPPADPAPAAPAARTEAPAPVVDPEIARLRAENARLEGALDRASNMPQRQGRAAIASPRTGADTRDAATELISRAKEKAPNLARAVESRIEILSDDMVAKRGRGDLEATLRSVCVAAEADGELVDPELKSSWA